MSNAIEKDNKNNLIEDLKNKIKSIEAKSVSNCVEESDSTYSSKNKDDEYILLYKKATKLLSNRAHSKFELKQKLKKSSNSIYNIEKVLSSLEEKSYIGDNSFARAYADELIRSKRYGKKYIKQKMLQKRIPEDIIDGMNDLFDSISWGDIAFEVILKKYNIIETSDINSLSSEEKYFKEKQKIHLFLESRGFDYDIINITIKRFFSQK